MAEAKRGHGLIGIVLAFLAVSGCEHVDISKASSATRHEGPPVTAKPDVATTPTAPQARVTTRPANPLGKVFIAEYHHIRSGKNNYFRSPDEFRSDLSRLYKDGFRPCTVSQYLENKMILPPGASPVVFTFDDAIPTQILFKPDGTPDPNCALGIWQDFAKGHPDFPIRATFYVLPDTMWGQPKFTAQKVALLKELGCEMGNHTVTHPILKRKTDEQVKWELATATDDLEKLGVPLPVSLALPYGVSPKNKQLLHSFVYNGRTYAMKAVLLVGAEPARSPLDKKFNRYAIPRIQAYDGPLSLDYWLTEYEHGRVKVYVAP